MLAGALTGRADHPALRIEPLGTADPWPRFVSCAHESRSLPVSTKVDAGWRERYANKVESAEQAVRAIRHGARVFIGSGAAEPQSLVQALAAAPISTIPRSCTS